MRKTQDYFKRVETRIDKFRRVGGLVCKKVFSNISNLFIFSDEKYQLSKKKLLKPIYNKMQIIFIWYKWF